jgi:hypothetical protein
MSISASIHPQAFAADSSEHGVVWINADCGDSSYAAIFVSTTAQCDELIAAATDAKRLVAEVEAGGAS